MNFRKLTEKEVYALPRNQFVYLTDMYHLTLDGNVPPKLVHPNRTPVITGNAIIKGDDGMMFVTSYAEKICLDKYFGGYGKDWFVEVSV
jgi:hypothetical protein